MKLYLIRHGETLHNREKITQGHLDTNLSYSGFIQAQKVGIRLKEVKFDIIYSSNLLRAKITAQKIHEFQKCDIVFDERLRERNFGIFQGKKSSENN